MIRVRVPASTSNLGSGFDTFGLALQLYLTVAIETISSGLEIEVVGEGDSEIPTDKSNLVYKALQRFFSEVGHSHPNLKIENDDFEDDLTIGGYFELLLSTLFQETECFNGKRPFGNSGWEYDLYKPLIKAGAMPGTIDEDGYIDECDNAAGDLVVFNLIAACFGQWVD